jgi:hypothetical protein
MVRGGLRCAIDRKNGAFPFLLMTDGQDNTPKRLTKDPKKLVDNFWS